MTNISINGNNISVSGRNIVVSNGKVLIDGKDVTPDSKIINITVNGNIEQLNVDVCDKVLVTGSVGSVKTMSGDVDVSGDINGSVKTMSGDVDCYNVSGDISTMSGDVKHKKN
jgi:hypothetical protein